MRAREFCNTVLLAASAGILAIDGGIMLGLGARLPGAAACLTALAIVIFEAWEE